MVSCQALLSQVGEGVMNINDPIGDMITRIRNAHMRGKELVDSPSSTLRVNVLEVLKEEGFIWGYEVDASGEFPQLKVKVKYVEGIPALTDLKRESKPGLRRYVGVEDIPKVLGGLGMTILSTSKGLMAGHKAKKENIGGELIASVW